MKPYDAKLFMVNIDCSDPPAMAKFYAGAFNWETLHSTSDYSMVSNGSVSLGFGRVDGFHPPEWPDTDHAKQFHLDVQVSDVPEALAACQEMGARLPDFQPGGDRWTVLLDPEGRPFCLFPKNDEGAPSPS